MADVERDASVNPLLLSEVAFDYIKSGDFRTVWVDGAIGGITPSGLIHFAVYSERQALPQRQVFSLADDGEIGQKLGAEIADKRVSREGIVREMPVDLMLSAAVAESLAQWLMQQVETLKEAQSPVKK